ncbi:hypothetical protein C5167_032973 [Papaver somniferum]|uniref:RNase H type-1 domain-containing protein n=1 Tax=Papaver somniferum TaxID=3469 RepID=A0A4Y7K917_PAPSO|nr:uncharacterized protein LOC113293167 [Papaver somniferum]RZC69844.1 hypothetical protein C5167_032973 [Papaver somniferum]
MSSKKSCIVEFDGAAKGNPGPAGAGAVLRSEDGRVICRLSEGVGNATNNVAEYRGMLLGVKHAMSEGYERISVQGDSQLVTNQVEGHWRTRSENLQPLCSEVQGLRNNFDSFEARHVPRDYNRDANDLANMGVHLKDGEVRVYKDY